METCIGIRVEDRVLVAVSGLTAFYYMTLTHKEDKIAEIDTHKLAAATGEQSDRVRLLKYVQCALKPSTIQTGKPHSTESAANFMRTHMAQSLRSRQGMYQANVLFAGYDLPSEVSGSKGGASLYWVDYLAAMQKVNYGAHGYGGSFITAVLDEKYRPDLTLEDAKALLKECIATVEKRLIVNQGSFIAKVVDKDGIREIEL